MHRNKFLLVLLLWLVIFGVFIFTKEHTLRTGDEVLLRTVPVDPRDMFRGDYVVLRYEISTVTADTSLFHAGQDVYVVLQQAGDYVVAGGAYPKPPTGSQYLKGTVVSSYGNRLTVEYGIESYFVPEGRGRELERQVGKTIDVRVAIDSRGNGVIKEVLVDGVPF